MAKKLTDIQNNTGDTKGLTTTPAVSIDINTKNKSVTTYVAPLPTVTANFSYSNQTYKPAVTKNPKSSNAISANAAFEAKYPATNKNNFK